MIKPIFEKIATGVKLTEDELLELLTWADKANALILPAPQQVTLHQTNVTPLIETVKNLVVEEVRSRIPNLAALSQMMGLQIAGEFRTGNGLAPGDGFTGGRFGYPGFTYGGVDYFLVGVSNDALQVGLSLADGSIKAGSGKVILDSNGTSVLANSNTDSKYNSYKFVDSSGNVIGGLYSYTSISGANADLYLSVKLLPEDAIGADSSRLILLAATSDDSNAAPVIQLYDDLVGQSYIHMNEQAQDVDFAVWGGNPGTTPVIKVDANQENVGIGTVSPNVSYKLDVNGKINIPTGSTYDINGSPHTHTNIPNDGWIAVSVTWTRTGNHTFTVSGDVTATYRKGAKVRYKDGGAYEYGVVLSSSYSAPNTTVTLLTNTSYTMAAATITDTYLSYIENPEGWPDWFNYATTVSATGGSLTTVTVNVAKFQAVGQRLTVFYDISVTNNGTGSGLITITTPATTVTLASGSGRNTTTNNATIASVGAAGTTMGVSKYDGTYPVASGQILRGFFTQDY